MEIMLGVIMLALLEYSVFSFQVGMARAKYGIKAPATAGHEVFERHYRVQQNTLEQLMSFLPAMLAFSTMAEKLGWPGYNIASCLGLVWIVGRFIYAKSYVKEPTSRTVGFMLSFFPTTLMMLGTLVCVALWLLR